jgi:hypothetical protein
VFAAEALIKDAALLRIRSFSLSTPSAVSEQEQSDAFRRSLPDWPDKSLYLENICACIIHRRVSFHASKSLSDNCVE